MKKIIAIAGSLKSNSSNQVIINTIAQLATGKFDVALYDGLAELPHFNPDLDSLVPPSAVMHMRTAIEQADGVVICTPEYVFSIPSTLKNLIEWCVSTIVFSEKPTALITASASGDKGHEELQLLMQTLGAKLTPDTTILIKAIKGKVNQHGEINDAVTLQAIEKLVNSFSYLVH
ncbi:MAG: NADPH-dependent FMN reductase [Spirosomataceae bacterium]